MLDKCLAAFCYLDPKRVNGTSRYGCDIFVLGCVDVRFSTLGGASFCAFGVRSHNVASYAML